MNPLAGNFHFTKLKQTPHLTKYYRIFSNIFRESVYVYHHPRNHIHLHGYSFSEKRFSVRNHVAPLHTALLLVKPSLAKVLQYYFMMIRNLNLICNFARKQKVWIGYIFAGEVIIERI